MGVRDRVRAVMRRAGGTAVGGEKSPSERRNRVTVCCNQNQRPESLQDDRPQARPGVDRVRTTTAGRRTGYGSTVMQFITLSSPADQGFDLR
eukprot:COSAG01_NODE_2083_length_8462_cov_17.020567_4_plen_92_part_00